MMEYQVSEYDQSLKVDNKERERKVVRAFEKMLNVSLKNLCQCTSNFSVYENPLKSY